MCPVKKFRAMTRYDGRIIYGDLLHQANLTLIITEHYGWREVVEPESVAQLVCYDGYGREYYEGDIIIRDGKKYIVGLEATFSETD